MLAYADPWGDADLQPDAVARLGEPERSLVEPLAGPLLAALTGDQGDSLASGEWYIDWIEQSGRHLGMMQVMPDGSKSGLDGLFVWRLVRGLERGPVTIALTRRDQPAPPVTLHGWRRFFTNTRTGVISEAYQPGELTQALCSPWQHDFRDCSCHYWAANRPDIVHVAIAPGEPVLPDREARDPERAMMRVDWMRAEHTREATGAALNTMPVNRPYQMDDYQINRTWQDLNIVIGNTEIGARYVPQTADAAEPYASADELAAALRTLAPVEMTLAIEYLYARFSLLTAEEAAGSPWAELAQDVTFARDMLMLTAGSEMQHLRWTNELLWKLAEARLIKEYTPVLTPSETVPSVKGKPRPRRLCRLTDEILRDFIAVESPKGKLEADYARTVATLRTPTYPAHLSELAGRIVSDGLQHYTRLRDVRSALARYSEAEPLYPYVRELKLGTPEQAKAALAAHGEITTKLSSAYSLLARGAFADAGSLITKARRAMDALLVEGEGLAKQRIGIPFW
jgi:hypothetical protein